MSIFKRKNKVENEHKEIYFLFDKEGSTNMYVINSEEGSLYLETTKDFGVTPDYVFGEYLYKHGGMTSTQHDKIALIGNRSILKRKLVLFSLRGESKNFKQKANGIYVNGEFFIQWSIMNTLEKLLLQHGYKIKYTPDTSKERIKLVGRALTHLHTAINLNYYRDKVTDKIFEYLDITTMSLDKEFIGNGFLYGFEDSIVIGTYDLSKTDVRRYSKMIKDIETTTNQYLVNGKVQFSDNKIIYKL